MERERLLRRPTREEINDMPLRHYDGPLHIVRNLSEWREAEKDFRSDCVLGFDTETRPTFRKGKLNSPSLVQLAGANAVYLVQLAWLPFGEPCAQLLADPKIIKTGVGIHDDMAALARIYPFMPQSCVDLGTVAKANNLPNQGLRTLAANLFGWRISKGSQCSNWSSRNLSPRQIAYAATDAWIGRLIYLKLAELGFVDYNICNE